MSLRRFIAHSVLLQAPAWMMKDRELIDTLDDPLEEFPRCSYWEYIDLLRNRDFA